MMANPSLKPTIRISVDEMGYLAYDSEADRLHELNASAALIAELCDGSRTVEEIRALTSPALQKGGAAEGSIDAIDRFFNEGFDSGLLISTIGAAVRPEELSADELTRLAAHLHENGQLANALRCAKKVTQLTPDDAVAWHHLGRIAQAAGDRCLAREAYENYFSQHPDDAAIGLQLVALRDEPPPLRASDECVLQNFSNFATFYDSKMRDLLSYQAPERLQELIDAELGDSKQLAILDIGCGTGLAAAGLKPRAARLDGIDLSPEMIEKAQARAIYDGLEVAEITDWLTRSPAEFDLIVACDCLVYFGDLEPVTQCVAARLKAGGYFAFTVERGQKYPLHLADSGRFTHHPDHIREVAAKAELQVARLEEGFLRTEAGAEVIGLVTLLRKPGSA